MKSVGIDIGTSSISIVVMEKGSTAAVEKYTLANKSFIHTENSWERIQNSEIICAEIRKTLENILAEHSDIAGIGLTGQMHGILYVDKNGKALSPLYTWQDGRGNLKLPEFSGRSLCDILCEDHSVSAATGYGLVTHLYNIKRNLVPEGTVSFCTIADYIGMVLTGRKAPLLHISQAASTGFYNYDSSCFDKKILSELGMDISMLPELTNEFECIGTFRGIPVSVSIGDNQASFIGSVRDAENTVLANIGTGSQISLLSDKSINRRGIEARPFTKDSFLLVGAALCGGAAYAALENFLREYARAAGAPDVPQYDIMKKLLEADTQSSWKVKPSFLGTRLDPKETGSISGISLQNFHPTAIIRGLLDGMTEELYGLYEVICEETGIHRTKLMASGNGVRKNSTLQNILRARFAMPLELQTSEEEAALGAAMTALVSIGEISLKDHIGM